MSRFGAKRADSESTWAGLSPVCRIMCILSMVFLLGYIPSLWPVLLENARSLALIRLAASQSGSCEGESTASGSSWWYQPWLWGSQVRAHDEGQRSVLVTGEQLFQGRGQLYTRGDRRFPETASFDSYVTLFSNYDTFVTLNMPVGQYQLELHGVNDRPGPVLLVLFAGEKPLGALTFDKDDNSWETKCLLLHPIHWPQRGGEGSRLTIRVAFTNDGGERGSRDASIAWLRFTPLQLKTTER